MKPPASYVISTVLSISSGCGVEGASTLSQQGLYAGVFDAGGFDTSVFEVKEGGGHDSSLEGLVSADQILENEVVDSIVAVVSDALYSKDASLDAVDAQNDISGGGIAGDVTTTSYIPGECPTYNEMIVFADVNLEKAIHDYLKVPMGMKIYQKDVSEVKELELIQKGIVNLQGLECFTNVENVDLSDNYIIDIISLSRLTKLKELDLSFNLVSNVISLKDLVELQMLLLSHNQISDVGAFAGLQNVEQLELYENKIVDVSVLGKLGNLHALYLGKNKIIDVSVLGVLGQLKTLTVEGNPLQYNVPACLAMKGLQGKGTKVDGFDFGKCP